MQKDIKGNRMSAELLGVATIVAAVLSVIGLVWVVLDEMKEMKK